MKPHFISQPEVLYYSYVMEGQSGKETFGCVSGQKFVVSLPTKKDSSMV